MSSVVDIVNLALSHLGDDALVTAISPPDGSAQAALAGRFYPIARDELLEMHPWTFALTRVSLAVVPAAAPSQWAFAYAMPNKCIKPISVLPPTAQEDTRSDDYIIESDADGNGILYTNTEDAVLRFVRLVDDTTRFTPGFVSALGRLLASYLAGPIVKGTTGIQVAAGQLKLFAIELSNARTQDSNSSSRSTYRDRRSDAEVARGTRNFYDGFVR